MAHSSRSLLCLALLCGSHICGCLYYILLLNISCTLASHFGISTPWFTLIFTSVASIIYSSYFLLKLTYTISCNINFSALCPLLFARIKHGFLSSAITIPYKYGKTRTFTLIKNSKPKIKSKSFKGIVKRPHSPCRWSTCSSIIVLL